MEPFKNVYNPTSIKLFASAIYKADRAFLEKDFCQKVLKSYQELEMKDRVRLMATTLKECLPGNYKKQIKTLVHSLGKEGENLELKGFMVWPLTHFVEEYGLENFDDSFTALKEMTKKFTAEFAVRLFLEKDADYVFELFQKWREDENHHVRRLVSEGTRAHLPWGLKVKSLSERPERGLELIRPLVMDESEYVRKSVANHVNDVTHFAPELALKYLKKISQKNLAQKKLVKQASRTLLKKSHPKAFAINGYRPDLKFTVDKFKISPKTIVEGERIKISFSLQHSSSKKEKIQLALKIGYPKKNGKISDKVFHLKDLNLAKNELCSIEKELHFKKVTTRVHYPGVHPVSLLVNGIVASDDKFRLKVV